MLISLFPKPKSEYDINVDKEKRLVTIKYLDKDNVDKELTIRIPENVTLVSPYITNSVYETQVYVDGQADIQISVFDYDKMGKDLFHAILKNFGSIQDYDSYVKVMDTLDDIDKKLLEIKDLYTGVTNISAHVSKLRDTLKEIKKKLGEVL